ncbi:MAG TPA: HlyD family efflux transporter periplasmic adaptor subunit, partial [Vicinamibacterales bacterium]|nr:HlyD family efflux transporter periplasmic adaptor subunit [Vicinamibacterales bacterium]
MAQPFAHTLRSLEADRVRAWLAALACTALLLLAWSAWFFFARLPVYVVSDSARLEVNQAVHPIQSPVAGQIRTIHLTLGADVAQGDVLIDLDAEAQRLQLQEEQTRLDTLAPQLARISGELIAQKQGRREAVEGAGSAGEEARARLREAEAAASQAREELTRAEKLHESGLVPEIEFLRTRSDFERRQALAATLRLDIDRQRSEQRASDSEQAVRAERLEREQAVLRGQLATEKAIVERLTHERDQRRVRAPIDGRVGEIAEVHAGEFVRAGDRLAAIVPSGQLKAIAYFPPSTALGRIRQGQAAHLRLDGFPWIQYGSIAALVSNVASEMRDGRIRVELRLT